MTETPKRPPRKRSARSTIEELPPEIRSAIDDALKQGVTLDQIVKAVQAVGAEVSRSALGRYKLKYHRLGERLRRTREIADVFVSQLGAAPEGKQGRIITELAQGLVFDFLTPDDDGKMPTLDTEGLMFLGKAIKDLASAEKTSADRELKIREEERKRVLAEASTKVIAAGKAHGLSAEGQAAIRATLLGIKR
jgi:hypothetical protein